MSDSQQPEHVEPVAPAAGAASVTPQAQGAAPPLDPAIVAAIAASVRDSVFADLRRTGQLKQAKPPAETTNPGQSAAGPDLARLRQLDRAIARTGVGASLKDSIYQRMERDFQAESPPDAEAWVREYLDTGITAASPNQTQQTAAPAPRVGPPVSDGGAPPVSRVPLDEQDIMRMSETDRIALRKQLGDKKYVDRLYAQQAGKTFRIG